MKSITTFDLKQFFSTLLLKLENTEKKEKFLFILVC